MKETAGFKRRVEKLQDENHREEDSLRNLNFPVIFVLQQTPIIQGARNKAGTSGENPGKETAGSEI